MGAVRKERAFACKNCGKIVKIEEEGRHENHKLDRRCVFCSEKCSRQFWRKSPKVREARAERARRIEEDLGLNHE